MGGTFTKEYPSVFNGVQKIIEQKNKGNALFKAFPYLINTAADRNRTNIFLKKHDRKGL